MYCSTGETNPDVGNTHLIHE